LCFWLGCCVWVVLWLFWWVGVGFGCWGFCVWGLGGVGFCFVGWLLVVVVCFVWWLGVVWLLLLWWLLCGRARWVALAWSGMC
ncbi:hypothetical protein RA264_27730, partial [Pseudomonas syringae pv. tagetis]|uniref:hypothetical protein n=1 Tax=Pseudomonas syringae group genomosp. 7 TaxID=251699 RepID=UPI00376FA3D3